MLHHPTLADSLIDPARIDHPPRRDHGYLDVLGPESDEPVSVANRFMQSPLLAAIYEPAWRPMFTRGFSYGGKSTLKAHTALMDEIAGRGDHKILDVACGPGLYTRELAAQLGMAGVCIGLDLSGPMLRRAVRDNSAERVDYIRGSAHSLPFADATFDTVVCLAALYLIPDPEQAVRELCRVAGPDGQIVVFTSLRTRAASLPGVTTAMRIGGFRAFGRDEVTGWLRAQGWTDIDQTVTGQGQFIRARRAVALRVAT
ncbi:Similarity with UbiE/COQ5 methyltransferase [Mycobacteroides abscessus subsp. bolletii]|uniref:class I SAM-dependent methyltransferase n=1 Tax=Mycobacteroides abscessus TaxID=36809 RepID=UPI00092C83D1|nr:class I SAM-dependent methyltransferase [Mycobacteroides abscessus]SHX51514.1 Similarity with UbiE/COQ5 methyltransferase [Mycobacteroides abscessus subsp. bolletii]SKP63595.1 Similarity with UbiE/COQ5 methyltransferase [Mycobacteroides abscessus subsp. bolletii]SKP72435.1 Similarity with UbiE/COQ5 methyltransferase [Mycobacteroides abscessus subsp. bolletii]SKQ24424.1 Similarity with UbiE/COQ5 methyltransferase [Mycobacteroides abscessus subsp. bolletii]